MPRLCAFGCASNGVPMHSFPNIKKYPERFKTWVTLVCGKLDPSFDYEEYYKKKRICDIHFTDRYRNRNNRLNAEAVPTLHLPGPTLHGFPNPNKDPERFRSWVLAVGGDILGLDNSSIYTRCRVCHLHFETIYQCRNSRLSNIAVPTKYLL
ncbi:hypothetical protein ABMA27_003374, partial [Loxostege sticticalis]